MTKKYDISQKVLLKNGSLAIILENNLRISDYLVAYKKQDGSWSTMNCLAGQIEGPWIEKAEIIFTDLIMSANDITHDLVIHVSHKATIKKIKDTLVAKKAIIHIKEV